MQLAPDTDPSIDVGVSTNHFLERIVISNFKSIERADISLGPLTFLVGPNGSGKSNVLDAISFLADALNGPLDHALRDRGGINEVRRRSSGHPTNFGLRLEFALPSGTRGHYVFEIAARPNSKFIVKDEACVLYSNPSAIFRVKDGRVDSTLPSPPAATKDRLYLVNVSGTPEFREVFDTLSNLRVYNISPSSLKALQEPSSELLLSRDGANITTVYENIVTSDPITRRVIEEYLRTVVPGVKSVDVRQLGPVETLEFKQEIQGAKYPWKFIARNMSDGTLRAFGMLVALFQQQVENVPRAALIGIEEPEVSLHPAALGVILESLQHASRFQQILVTSHSPELLDDPSIHADAIRAVISTKNATSVLPIAESTRQSLKDGLFSAGELLRLNQIEPDYSKIALQSQISLFQ
jgi:predicted ATPase